MKLRVLIALFIAFIVLAVPVCAQQLYTLHTEIRAGENNEALPAATLAVTAQGGITTYYTADNNGNKLLKLAKGKYTVTVSYAGYNAHSTVVDLYSDKHITISLVSNNILNTVTVNARAARQNVTAPQMGVTRLDAAVLNKVPALFGERDVLKVLQLTPGVKGGAEGNTGLYVRGGATDQNLILLDDAVIYNPAHLGGLFSSFNAAAVKDITLYKAGMPARFGGRLSSVINVTLANGNDTAYHAEGGVGLISSNIKAEGPIKSKQSSFAISARRTYIDIFKPLVKDTSIKNSSLSFYDVNARLNFILGSNTTLAASASYAQDYVGLAGLFNNKWGNTAATLKLSHIFNNGLGYTTAVTFNSFNYDLKLYDERINFTAQARVNGLGLRQELSYNTGAHRLMGGLQLQLNGIKPLNVVPGAESSLNALEQESRRGADIGVYASDDYKISPYLTVNYGLRLSYFGVLGPGTFNTYLPDGTVSSVSHIAGGKILRSYIYAEPRINIAYEYKPDNSIKVSYARNTQNIHVLTNSDTGAPSDVYVLSSNNIRPEVSDQVSLGWFRNFSNNVFEFSAEAYYKWMANQIDYKNGAILIANPQVESQLLYGRGKAYGLELFIKKRYGRLNGWAGYTISKVQRQINGINNGSWYYAPQDRRHDFSLVALYQLTPRIGVNGVFAYSTGYAITYPEGKYTVAGQTAYYYGSRNSNRSPYISHLDFSVVINGKDKHKLKSSWSIGAYNVLDRKNPWAISFRNSKTKPQRTEAVQTSLFGIVPFVSWNFKI